MKKTVVAQWTEKVKYYEKTVSGARQAVECPYFDIG
jgi:hypothetical protein